MHVIADLCLIPIGVGVSVSNEIATCERVLAEVGLKTTLHTWGQTLQPHPHVHCVVLGGGLSPDHGRWISSRSHFFLPVKVLSRIFRGKFVAGLRRTFRNHHLVFYGECLSLRDEKKLRNLPALALSAGLDRLRQAAVWRARTRPTVSGSPYASRRHFQPPDSPGQRLPSDFPMEGRRASQQATHHDPFLRRVPAALPTASPA